ncbi:hypothetical protein H0O02_02735 [Candidatus Micrarchaeota archaeon]|nr:hypothetical protein [Candidatus Micrarchaeota archaeon]
MKLKQGPGKQECALSASTYRYLMTIARRSGASGVRARIFIRHGDAIALVKSRGGGKFHLLPSCGIHPEADGEEMEEEIRKAAARAGLDAVRITRYMGSRSHGEEQITKCFDFEAIADGRGGDVFWAGKTQLATLEIPEEEKRAVASYFRKGQF